MDKKLTVVIPVRNRQSLVMRTLESVAAQTSKEFQLIVVDNGSTDRTAETVGKWADEMKGIIDVQLIDEPQPGAARARNRGLQAVVTPYVTFFDSDDEMRPNFISNILETIQRHPDADLVRWAVSIIDPDGWMKIKDQHFHDELQLHLLHGTLSTVRYAAKTDLIRSIGGWNEKLSTFDDLELGIRLLVSDPQIMKINGEPTVAIHPTEDSISGTRFTDRYEAISRAFDEINQILASANRHDDLFILDCRRAIMAADLRREGSAELSRQMLARSKQNKTAKQRMKLQTIYTIQRLIGRGGSAATQQLAGKKRERH